MSSRYDRSSGYRTQQIRQLALRDARTLNQPKTTYNTSNEVFLGTTLGEEVAAEKGCCAPPAPAPPTPIIVGDEMYMVGTFYDILQISNGSDISDHDLSDLSATPITEFNNSVYLAKFNKDGVAQWIAKIGVQNEGVYLPYIVADSDSNIYIIGESYGTPVQLYNAGSTTVDYTLSVFGENDAHWVAKYNALGQVQWATYILGDIRNIPAITVDAVQNVYIIGSYDTSVLIYDKTSTVIPKHALPSAGQDDNYIVKYNSSGIFQWASHIGGTDDENSASITCDNGGNVYVSGFYQSNDLTVYNSDYSTAFTLPHDGQNDVYLIKYNSVGVALWGTYIGGSNSENRANISTDSTGSVYIAGFYRSNPVNIYSEGNPVAAFTLQPKGNWDFYFVKYSGSGVAQWVRGIGGVADEQQPYISVDTANNILVSGASGSITIDEYTPADLSGTTILTMTGTDYNNKSIFLIKYSSAGTRAWATWIGNTQYYSPRPAITSDVSDNTYVVGRYSNTTLSAYSTDSSPALNITTVPGVDCSFIVKYDSAGIALWTAQTIRTDVPNVTTAFKAWF